MPDFTLDQPNHIHKLHSHFRLCVFSSRQAAGIPVLCSGRHVENMFITCKFAAREILPLWLLQERPGILLQVLSHISQPLDLASMSTQWPKEAACLLAKAVYAALSTHVPALDPLLIATGQHAFRLDASRASGVHKA